MAVFGEEGEGAHFAARVDHDAVISAPVPIGDEHFIAGGGVVVHGVVERAGAAARGEGADVSLRTGLTEALVDAVFEEIRIALDRRVGYDLAGREAFVRSLDDVEHDELAVFVQNGADGAVDDLVFPDLFRQSVRSVICRENIIFCVFAFCLHGCHAVFCHVASSCTVLNNRILQFVFCANSAKFILQKMYAVFNKNQQAIEKRPVLRSFSISGYSFFLRSPARPGGKRRSCLPAAGWKRPRRG